MSEFVEIVGMDMNLADPTLKPNDGGFSSIEPGTYEFEVTKAMTGTSGSGNNTLKITAKVVGPEDSPQLNRTMTNSYVMNDKQFSRERMLAFLQASGAEYGPKGFAIASLVGLRFIADVEKRPFETVDKNTGAPVTKDFTSWVRERAVEAEAAPTPPPQKQATANPNAARRPAAPNGNRPQQPR